MTLITYYIIHFLVSPQFWKCDGCLPPPRVPCTICERNPLMKKAVTWVGIQHSFFIAKDFLEIAILEVWPPRVSVLHLGVHGRCNNASFFPGQSSRSSKGRQCSSRSTTMETFSQGKIYRDDCGMHRFCFFDRCLQEERCSRNFVGRRGFVRCWWGDCWWTFEWTC